MIAIVAMMTAACAEGREPASVTEWLGPEPHGEIHGEIGGQRVDVVAAGDQVRCKREYTVPDPDPTTWSEGRFDEIEILLDVTIDGVERRYEIELFNHDFAEAMAGDSLRVVPVAVPGAPVGADEIHAELQWEWESGDSLIDYEQLAVAGRVELRELSGMVGPDGLVIPAGQGRFGAFIELQLPDGAIAASFTAPCSEVEVEAIE